jgi:hypothetical protein
MVEMQSAMKARLHTPHRVIRQIDTGLYLAPDGHWVPGEEDAFDFPDLHTALATCEQMQQKRVEMVMIFEPGASRAPFRASR